METNGLSQYRYYVMAPVAPFFLFFLLDCTFTALSMFSWIPWIVPNNVPVNQLFGAYSGLGMNVLMFSWRQISRDWESVDGSLVGGVSCLCRCVVCVRDVFLNDLLSPLGFVLFFWILMPVLYYTNIWDPRNLPISANEPYDRFGKL